MYAIRSYYGFVPGGDVRQALTGYEPGEDFNSLQIKAWKNTGSPVEIVGNAGHDIHFAGRTIFPTRFLLRHYPIRSQEHGLQKVFRERKKRFNPEEKQAGWHIQYDQVQQEDHNFLHDQASLKAYDGNEVRARLLSADVYRLMATRGDAGASTASNVQADLARNNFV